MENAEVLVRLDNVFVRIANTVILSDINWKLMSNESWAVLGGNGAGKTTFLRLLRGDIWPDPAHGLRLYRINGKEQESPISFREKTGIVSPDLLDRYRTGGWNFSGLEVVCTGFRDTPVLYDKPAAPQLERACEIMAALGLEELSNRSLLSMSHGEAKKILIARALVHKPMLLFLDEMASGLDSGSKKALTGTVERAAAMGTQIICVSHDVSEVPPVATKALLLHGGRIIENGGIDEVSHRLGRVGKAKPKVISDPNHGAKKPQIHDESLIRIANVDVSVGRRRILNGINWAVKSGENWAVFGKNGSGKTTLLKLIAGDLRPVWGGTIRRFGSTNRDNLWKIRQLISFVSPDLQHGHVLNQSGLEMVISGFHGSTGLPEQPTESQIEAAQYWFRLLGIEQLQNREVSSLSYGQIRILLILRAVVTRPKMILLDEPMSGLDSIAKSNVRSIIESLAGAGASLIYVSHAHDELLDSITHVAVIEKGKMVFQGTKSEWQGLDETPGMHCVGKG